MSGNGERDNLAPLIKRVVTWVAKKATMKPSKKTTEKGIKESEQRSGKELINDPYVKTNNITRKGKQQIKENDKIGTIPEKDFKASVENIQNSGKNIPNGEYPKEGIGNYGGDAYKMPNGSIYGIRSKLENESSAIERLYPKTKEGKQLKWHSGK
ncbi:hypothetical protein BBW65_01060 [Helicobacter enhydrae]|uniref:Uncharacterized protein n=1 Tax=Helicobacter enhydrae TaxID=222136 RepID=A0A1B1U3Y4_9HELI|nr:hypothetical protein [Helicobacter enhydrae]ANV97487.1 hypothetical protein BBW65_01060 [Helicobacter enhydrae]